MRQYSAFKDIVAGAPLFRGIPCTRLTLLLEDDRTYESAYARGEVVFSPASYQEALGIVLSGSALVYKLGGEQKRVLMSRLSPGHMFGMAALFSNAKTYPTEIRAEKDLLILFLSKAWLEHAFAKEPLLSRNYIVLLSERIHFLTLRIDALAGDDVHARLLRVLAGLHVAQAPAEAFTLPFSLSQLAELLGVGRASLYRALDTLAAEGILRREGKRITVLQPDALTPFQG